MTLADIVSGAIGSLGKFCDGYGNPGARGLGYLTVLKLEIGEAPLGEMDEVLAEIVSYDSAETTVTYLGQINAIRATGAPRHEITFSLLLNDSVLIVHFS